jgi:exopolysaccharide production protein ExoY
MMNYDQQKRILDIAMALILIIIFLPIWILVPILIFLESGKPIFYAHKRIGKNGKNFLLYKFRSMVQNADEILHNQNKELLKKFKKGDWKVEAKNDPRITKLGRVMRALTIDEFPQLINVLRGEMSLIGPRAYLERELVEQTKKYPETKKLVTKILSIKPGITGPWQTSGRNEVPFFKRAEMDAKYAEKKSILEDFKIIFKTPKAMVSKW